MTCETTLTQARLLHRVIRHLQSRLARTHSGGMPELTLPQINALMVVQDSGSLSLKQFAQELNVSAPSASGMAERLVEMDVLCREQSLEDRREVRLSLSRKGRKILETFESQFLANLVEVLERIGPKRAEQWCAIYEHIDQVMNRPDCAEPEKALEGTR